MGISVFDKDVTLPKSCQDFSVIPRRHLDWYKSIFVKNERSVPPYADAIIMAVTSGKNVSSGGKFIVELIKEFTSNIQKVYFFNDKRYVITNSDIYCEDKVELSFTKSGKGSIAMVNVFGENPLVCYLKEETLSFNDLSKNQISTLTATSAFSANGLVYSVNNGD